MPQIQRHDPLPLHAIDVVAVDPALLNFGIDVFQAVMNGAMPVGEYDGDDLACTGMNVLARQIGGHGLTPVSYTHLDVYKRQVRCRADRRRT